MTELEGNPKEEGSVRKNCTIWFRTFPSFFIFFMYRVAQMQSTRRLPLIQKGKEVGGVGKS